MELLTKSVQVFFENDDNSVIAPGIRDTITKFGVKKRKRFILDTTANLYLKYISEGNLKMSRALFYKLKPYWVVSKKLTGRDTCLCKKHSNFQFLLNRLSSLKILASHSSSSFIQSLVCDMNNKQCMYRACVKCKNKKVESRNNTQETWYYKWVTKKENRPGAKGLMYNVTITSKTKINCSIDDLIAELNSETESYLMHIFDTTHQYNVLSSMCKNLSTNEVMLVGDFSQNYNSKYSEEVHSVHFGASAKQISMHTGAFFYKSELNGKIKCRSFCTTSENLRHDAPAIWAHLQPVLNEIKKRYLVLLLYIIRLMVLPLSIATKQISIFFKNITNY